MFDVSIQTTYFMRGLSHNMTPDKTELMTITMIDAMINLMIGRHMATV